MDAHLSREELLSLFSYSATPAEVSDCAVHISECPKCWALAADVMASLRETKKLVPARKGRSPEWQVQDLRDALIVLIEAKEQKSIGWLKAKGWWAELKDLSPREQAEKISSVAAVHQHQVVETILREAKILCRKDPYSGEHLAMTAYRVLDHIAAEVLSPRLKDRLRLSAMTIVANSRRIAGNWQGSFAAISHAKTYLFSREVDEPSKAYLFSIHASLVGDTGQLEEALILEDMAADIYERAGDLKALATIKIQSADTLQRANKPGEAILHAEHALTLLRPDCTWLQLLARSIVTESLLSLGRLSEALENYEATKPLYDEAQDELTALKVECLEAKILDAMGCARESEKLFRSAIAGVTDMEIYRLAFLWRFAFFESLVKRGALGKAAKLCEEGIEILQENDRIHPQMTQVWQGLLAAVKAEALKEVHLAEMREYLVRHWATPAARAPFSRRSGE